MRVYAQIKAIVKSNIVVFILCLKLRAFDSIGILWGLCGKWRRYKKDKQGQECATAYTLLRFWGVHNKNVRVANRPSIRIREHAE